MDIDMGYTDKTPAQLIAESGYTDLGLNHAYKFIGWSPDGRLNAQYDGIPDIDPVGATVVHLTSKGVPCMGFIHFASPEFTKLEEVTKKWCAEHKYPWAAQHIWQVQSLNPLHLSPSLLCNEKKGGCGDHGFIENGRWRVA